MQGRYGGGAGHSAVGNSLVVTAHEVNALSWVVIIGFQPSNERPANLHKQLVKAKVVNAVVLVEGLGPRVKGYSADLHLANRAGVKIRHVEQPIS